MKTGMLWFDNSKASLEVKIKKAAEYYEKKHGCKPDLVLIHPSMLGDRALNGMNFESDGLVVRTYRPVLPGHIWLGIEDKEQS